MRSASLLGPKRQPKFKKMSTMKMISIGSVYGEAASLKTIYE